MALLDGLGVEAVLTVNDARKRAMARKVAHALGGNLRGKTIAVLWLAFKPNTDDMRFAPSIDIIADLVRRGAKVKAYDPQAMDRARRIIPGIEFCDRAEDVADDADLLALVTEWPEFRKLDLTALKQRMRVPVICDGRNVFERSEVEQLGFTYLGIGR